MTNSVTTRCAGNARGLMQPAIEAFELLASKSVRLMSVDMVPVDGLIHPVHRSGAVYGSEIGELQMGLASPIHGCERESFAFNLSGVNHGFLR